MCVSAGQGWLLPTPLLKATLVKDLSVHQPYIQFTAQMLKHIARSVPSNRIVVIVELEGVALKCALVCAFHSD
jgi:hypothetical protein